MTETSRVDDPVLRRVRRVAAGTPGLSLLALHGSRARGDAHAGSDWDFAYLGDRDLDVLSLSAALVGAVGTDRVDLVDLSRAGGLIRYRVARDGVVCFERAPGLFEDFAYRAVIFWLDAQHVIRPAYEHVLGELG